MFGFACFQRTGHTAGTVGNGVGKSAPDGTTSASSPCAAPRRLTPLSRPPLPLLTALDDDSDSVGETWRVREETHVIGRTTGHTVIAHDPAISERHARIVRSWRDGRYVWKLDDLDSTNGVYLRVPRLVLRPGRTLLIGSRRYTYEGPESVGREAEAYRRQQPPIRGTVAISERSPLDGTMRVPKLVAIDGAGRTEFELPDVGGSLGRSGSCDVTFDDPFLAGIHARIIRDSRDRLLLVAANGRNALWQQVRTTELGRTAEFLVGEQRFLWRLP